MTGPRWAGLVSAAVAVALAATGCSPAPADQRPADSLVVALGFEPETLNPIFQKYFVYEGNKYKIFNGLLRYDKDLRQVPDLAAEMPQQSPDGRTVTARLRQDVRFHDGRPLTAEDVVFTFTAILDPTVGAGFRGQLDSLRSVEALDRYTVRFSLNRVDPVFLDKLQMGITPRHLLAGQDLDTAAFNANPVGTGAYVFKEWRKGERLVLEANPDHFAGPPKVRRIVFMIVPDENARAALMENGAADMAAISPRLAERLRRDDGLRVLQVRSADARFLPLPNNNPNLADPRVRRAFSLAVDRQQMVQSVLVGAGEPAYGPIIAGHWAYSPVAEVPYDPDRARQLLTDAGWRDSDGDGVREKDGRRLEFTLLYPASDSVRKDLALATSQDLAEVGVQATLLGLGFEEIATRLDQDSNVYGGGSPLDPDLVARDLFYGPLAGDDNPSTNYPKMRNPAVDAALDAARTTLDRDQRVRGYAELQRALAEDGSYLHLVRLYHVVAVSNRLKGFDPQLEGHGSLSRGTLWNSPDWEVGSDA